MLIFGNICLAQNNFDEFISRFKPLNLPIDDINHIKCMDTLSGVQTNNILMPSRGVNSRPFYIDKNGDLLRVMNYYGLYPTKPSRYGCGHSDNGKWIDSVCYFHNKILPIGKLNLRENNISIIIKVISQESIFYDLWNLNKEGKPLSVICLFYGLKENIADKSANYTVVHSKINISGEIIWFENNRGLETFRTYKLEQDGYFHIIKEEQKGEFEY
jgi:hypothetical protein